MNNHTPFSLVWSGIPVRLRRKILFPQKNQKKSDAPSPRAAREPGGHRMNVTMNVTIDLDALVACSPPSSWE